MAPFPETEIMTIKRLEVALRKMDLKLLKDGAYKLHEKFHSGHRFEYIDLLKDIYMDVVNGTSIPEEIKSILTPTIEDILAFQGEHVDAAESPLNSTNVSSLTSLSYNIAPQDNENEHKASAFDVFGAPKENKFNSTENTYVQNPAQVQKQENIVNEININEIPNDIIENDITYANDYSDILPNENIVDNQTNIVQETQLQNDNVNETTVEEQNISYPINEEIHKNFEEQPEIKKEVKSIAIFFGTENSNEKIKNIAKYRELISKLKEEHKSINDILSLISEINTQSNINVSELKTLLEKLNTKENPVNLITNSQSAHFIALMKENNISYSIFNSSENKRINLLPVMGLTNLFKCCECNEEYLDENDDIVPLILQCPRCKSPMFADFYTTNGQSCELNMNYYNNALIALANSKVWLLIHPVLEEKTMVNMLKSALKMSNHVEEIYILDRDINVREIYKNMFFEINENIKINTQITVFEDFLNLIEQ